jgi:precorrin-6Y C5,15-methyltransferase (decarboxylating)
MTPVVVIGMGLSPKDLTEEHLRQISAADILAGGRRHLEPFKELPAEKKVVTGDLSELIRFIQERMDRKRIVVLASGDPLFYGIGSVLVEALGRDHVVVYPNVSSVAGAFARIRESWHEARIISLHGRDNDSELLDALEHDEKIAVLTDPEKTPARVAKSLLGLSRNSFEMCVLEKLGSPDERIGWYTPEEASEKNFQEPNLIILKRTAAESAEPGLSVRLGAADDAYEPQAGLITKAEVRAIALSKLRLDPHHTFWDLGAGSGSIGIEASLFLKKGIIVSVEKNEERIEQIRKNRDRFGVRNLRIVRADLPDGLADLPAPDRIFIGGGGKSLGNILAAAAGFLKPGGIVVVNTVLVENIAVIRKTFEQLGFASGIVQVQISRGRRMPWGERLEALNPVWIVSGEKRA